MNSTRFALCSLLAFAISGFDLHADTFGTGTNTFTIDFATIGNPGNADDSGAGGGIYSYAAGGVGYLFRLGVYEISQNQLDRATASGLLNVTAGAHTGDEPAAGLEWYEAAAFVNWLNTSTGHQAAYNLTFSGSWSMALWSIADAWQLDGENRYRHKDAFYYLPSEDEWYKGAYHQNDGVTANYWDYALGSNSAPIQELNGGTIPGSAVYDGSEPGTPADPADITLAGGLSPYGTMAQNGNVVEWIETAFDGSNDVGDEFRVTRGGRWGSAEGSLRSSFHGGNDPSTGAGASTGFRVASVPEPSCALLVACSLLLVFSRRTLRTYERNV